MIDDIRIQVLDPVVHTLIGIIWTRDSDPGYLRSLIPAGHPALIDGPDTDPYCVLP